jgi:hypothetical protein
MKDQSNTIDEKNIASRDHTLHPRLYLILFHLFFLLLFLSRFIFILFIIIDNNPFSFRSSLSLFLLCVCVCVLSFLPVRSLITALQLGTGVFFSSSSFVYFFFALCESSSGSIILVRPSPVPDIILLWCVAPIHITRSPTKYFTL